MVDANDTDGITIDADNIRTEKAEDVATVKIDNTNSTETIKPKKKKVFFKDLLQRQKDAIDGTVKILNKV